MPQTHYQFDDKSTLRVPVRLAWGFVASLLLGAFCAGGVWFRIEIIPKRLEAIEARQRVQEEKTHQIEVELRGVKTKLGMAKTQPQNANGWGEE